MRVISKVAVIMELSLGPASETIVEPAVAGMLNLSLVQIIDY